MAFETIIYEETENVATITLNRPEVLNAQNDILRSEIVTALEKAVSAAEVRVIVLTGAGEKAFSAGADISMFSVWGPVDALRHVDGKKRACELIREIPKPVIAVVKGLALGGGCEIAMACDLIIASENARFGQPEINVGVIPGGGGTQLLTRIVGEKKAKELVFTGDLISAQKAYELGLINKVVSREDLPTVVNKLTQKLKSKSPVILKFAKLAVNRALETPLSVGMEIEKELFAMCFGTDDQKEGAKAFQEKRVPVYKGK